MPVMDGLQATRIIRSYEDTGNWDAAAESGIEQPMNSTDSQPIYQDAPPKRTPIIAVSICDSCEPDVLVLVICKVVVILTS